jgi:hypothetical protein
MGHKFPSFLVSSFLLVLLVLLVQKLIETEMLNH